MNDEHEITAEISMRSTTTTSTLALLGLLAAGSASCSVAVLSSGAPSPEHPSATSVARHFAWPQETVRYQCEGGMNLQVAYLRLEDGSTYAALYYDGTLSLMRDWPAASGARYISLDEQVGLRWHSKGDRGVLAYLAPDHTAREQVLLSDCRAQPTP